MTDDQTRDVDHITVVVEALEFRRDFIREALARRQFIKSKSQASLRENLQQQMADIEATLSELFSYEGDLGDLYRGWSA
jgi:hypothetical protein